MPRSGKPFPLPPCSKWEVGNVLSPSPPSCWNHRLACTGAALYQRHHFPAHGLSYYYGLSATLPSPTKPAWSNLTLNFEVLLSEIISEKSCSHTCMEVGGPRALATGAVALAAILGIVGAFGRGSSSVKLHPATYILTQVQYPRHVDQYSREGHRFLHSL